MVTYRSSNTDKVREIYNRLSEEERRALEKISPVYDKLSSIEKKLMKKGLTFDESEDALKRCLFDEKVEKSCLEQKVEPENKDSAENKNLPSKLGYIYTRQEEVCYSTNISGVSIAHGVEKDQFTGIGAIVNYAHSVGDQSAFLGAAVNYAHSVGEDQSTFFGAAVNYAHSVGRNQYASIGAVVNYAHSVGRDQFVGIGAAVNYAHSVRKDQFANFGAAINYAHSVGRDQFAGSGAINIANEILGSQFAITGCAINLAQRVGKHQFGLVNIVTEEIKGKQIGLVNYAKELAEGAEQYGLINLQAKHRKKRWSSGPERWWNPEISFFYHSDKEAEKKGKRIESEGDARIEKTVIEPAGVDERIAEQAVEEAEREAEAAEEMQHDLQKK